MFFIANGILFVLLYWFFLFCKNVVNNESESETDSTPITEKADIPFEKKYIDEMKALSDCGEIAETRLELLKNSIIMEFTPLGNVIMFYDHKRESFVYYSDSVIPYRFLETIGRKYVITYNCKSLFVDMSEELRLATEKKDLEKEEREKTGFAHASASASAPAPTSEKKSVFAKLKSYNNDSSKSSSTKPATNKSSMDSTNIILKENANRYTCDGRFSNFMALKKVDKTLVDKRLKMTFADFKKMQQPKILSPSIVV